MIKYSATEDEISLLDDVDEVGYGEIYNVATKDGPTRTIEITEKQKNLLSVLRIVKKANRLIIHDGEPTMIEYRGATENGRKCLKKMKI